jgi:hypothetical protein
MIDGQIKAARYRARTGTVKVLRDEAIFTGTEHPRDWPELETRAPRGSGVFGGGAYRAVAAPYRVRGSGRSGHQPALIAGVGGTGVSARTIVLTGLAGLVAGAFSLGTGEYVSVTNQNELVHAEVAVERRMHALFPEAEQAQLQDTFRRYGADEDTATRMAAAVSRPRDRAPGAHPRGRCAMSSRRSRPAPPRVPRDRGRYGVACVRGRTPVGAEP